MATEQTEVVNFLISSPAMDYLTRKVPRFRAGLERVRDRADAVFDYPDGSLQLEGSSVWSDLWNNLVPADHLEAVDHNLWFRGLNTFGRKVYDLWYTAEYQRKLGDRGFHIIPAGALTWADEERLADLKVTILFRRKLSTKVVERFAELIARWRNEISAGGMFGEGPIRFLSESLEIYNARAIRFVIDVRESGQNTLNWLSLCLLGFGYHVAPVYGVLFNCEHCLDYPNRNYIEAYGEIELKNVTYHPMPSKSQTNAASIAMDKASPPLPRWPTLAKPHPLVRSDAFPVLATPKYSWEDLEVRVYFGAGMSADTRVLLQRLVNSWLDMGSFGGWGGTGIAHAGAITFEEADECAMFGVDMGDSADAGIALTVLVRVLEHIDATVVPIDAVVFGKF